MSQQTVKTFRVEPSPLLGKLAAFLPQLKAANEKLENDIAISGQEAYSIETVNDDSEQVIHMNLNLGILEEVEDDSEPTLRTECNNNDTPDIVMPWQVHNTTQDDTSMDNNNNDNDDISCIIDTSDILDEQDYVVLGGSHQDGKIFQQGQQLLSRDTPISAKDAVTRLHELGFEPVGDVNAAIPLPTRPYSDKLPQQQQQPSSTITILDDNDDIARNISTMTE